MSPQRNSQIEYSQPSTEVRACPIGAIQKVAGARRERSVRRHRQGCRPAVLKFAESSVQYVRGHPSRFVLNSTAAPLVLDCAVTSTGVHRRCCHGCCQKDSMSTFIWTKAAVSKS